MQLVPALEAFLTAQEVVPQYDQEQHRSSEQQQRSCEYAQNVVHTRFPLSVSPKHSSCCRESLYLHVPFSGSCSKSPAKGGKGNARQRVRQHELREQAAAFQLPGSAPAATRFALAGRRFQMSLKLRPADHAANCPWAAPKRASVSADGSAGL